MASIDVSPHPKNADGERPQAMATICPMCGKKSAPKAKEYRVKYCAGTCSKQADAELEAYLPKKV